MRHHKLTTHRADGRGRRRLRRPNVEALEQRSLLATITVTGTGDTIAKDGVVTLREAIEIANGTLDVGSLTTQEQAQVSGTPTTGTPGDTIAFDIPGAGVHTIRSTTGLPIIRDPVVIDGYTQPGSSPNTLDVGDNAALRIELQGGLLIAIDHTTVRGLVINHGALQVGDAFGQTIGGDLIEGNFIGTDPTGTVAEGGDVGIVLQAPNTTIGGTTPAARNIISGNSSQGALVGANLLIYGNNGNLGGDLIAGNYIGPDASGTVALRSRVGIQIEEAEEATAGSLDATIGGTTAAARNVISGNGVSGIEIVGTSNGLGTGLGNTVSGITVEGNFIGTDASGTSALGNEQNGIAFRTIPGSTPSPNNNLIGGTEPAAANVIAFNGVHGISMHWGYRNRILGNSIFSNSTLPASQGAPLTLFTGIDLTKGDPFFNGATPNDHLDADDGANSLQNFPVITSVASDGVSTTITGTLNSTPGRSFLIQFFKNVGTSPSSFGEGQTFIGSLQTAPTDASTGDVSFTAVLPVAVLPTEMVTATATDPDGNTSEFSQVVADLAVTATDSADPAPVGADLTYTITVTNTGTSAPSGPVTVTDPLPAHVTFVSATGGVTPVQGVLKLDLGIIPIGGSTTVTIVVRPDAAAAGTTITNTATVTSAVSDPGGSNDSATTLTTIAAAAAGRADLSVTVTGAPDPVGAGAEITYTITAANLGPDPAANVTLTDAIPAHTTLVSFTAPAGFTVTAPPAGGTGTVTATAASLASGASAVFTLVVRVATDTPGDTTISDTATVATTTNDPSPNDHSATATTAVNAAAAGSADLSLTVTRPPDKATAGQDLTYSVTVVNNGPSPATGVVLTDALPAGVTFVSVSQGDLDATTRAVTAGLGSLASGATATVRLVVRATAVGTFTNMIVVAANEADPSSANNRIQVVTTIAALPSGTATVPTSPRGDTTAPTVVNLQRFGYHTDPVSLVVTYSEAVSMSAALDLAHYSVRGRGKDGRFGTRDDRIISLRSLRRGPDPNSVVLHISGRLYAYVPYLLTVDGQGPGAVADLAGNRLDGDHDGQIGGDYIRRFNRNIIAGKAVDLRAAYETPSRVRMRGSQPGARRLDIPVAPGHRGSRT